MDSSRGRPTPSCLYCGSSERLTVDHVPPKCIFPSPRPSNLPTAQACERCNKAFGRDDEYLRDAIAMMVFDQPSAAGIVRDYERSIQRPRSARYKSQTLATLRDDELRTPAGIVLGRATICDIDGSRLLRSVERIMRGLFYFNEGIAIPATERPGVYERDSVLLQRPDLIPAISAIANAVESSAGRGTRFGDCFEYKYVFPDRSPGSLCTWWLLSFHGRMHFCAFFGRATAACPA